jgi:hypothetical protein
MSIKISYSQVEIRKKKLYEIKIIYNIDSDFVVYKTFSIDFLYGESLELTWISHSIIIVLSYLTRSIW